MNQSTDRRHKEVPTVGDNVGEELISALRQMDASTRKALMNETCADQATIFSERTRIEYQSFLKRMEESSNEYDGILCRQVLKASPEDFMEALPYAKDNPLLTLAMEFRQYFKDRKDIFAMDLEERGQDFYEKLDNLSLTEAQLIGKSVAAISKYMETHPGADPYSGVSLLEANVRDMSLDLLSQFNTKENFFTSFSTHIYESFRK